jgi:hypothetical protein
MSAIFAGINAQSRWLTGFGDQTVSSDALLEARHNYDLAIDRNLI